jgi:hypothetical protein
MITGMSLASSALAPVNIGLPAVAINTTVDITLKSSM